jgi:dihydroorotase
MLIKNGIVFDYENHIDGEKLDILITAEEIVKMAPSIKSKEDEILDAEGLFVIPGLVDMHAHLREPGQEHKETIETGTRAAAKGGITSVLSMPNTKPCIDNPVVIEEILERISKKAAVEVYLASAMTKGRKGLETVDFYFCAKAGCIAFSDDGSSVQNRKMIYEVCLQAKKENALLIEHPEIDFLSRNLPISYGKLEKLLGLQGQPAEAESLSILRFGTIAGKAGAKVHFTHISTQKSLAAVKKIKKNYPGLFTCDCTPHHLILSEEDNQNKDANKKINPPLRPEKDRQAINESLASGLIDAIATDHAPHSVKEKELSFEEAPFGTIGFETFLPATFTHLVETKKLSMLEWVKLVSYNPSRILGIGRGVLSPGKKANITVFDPKGVFSVNLDNIISKSKNSAFLGRKFNGLVKWTICGGKKVYEN